MVENIKNDVLGGTEDRKFLRNTNVLCPTCKKENLRIISDLENTVELECWKCLYNEFRPSMDFPSEEITDIMGRKINK